MIRQAIRTEYNGIVYDSKSEAVFARCLTLGDNYYIYHPVTGSGHDWDFLVFPRKNKPRRIVANFCRYGGRYYQDLQQANLRFEPVLIEYKPSCPSDTYYENLRKKRPDDNHIAAMVVYGNPWETKPDGESYVYHMSPVWIGKGDYLVSGSCTLDCFFNIGNFHIREALNYRFDLKEPSL